MTMKKDEGEVFFFGHDLTESTVIKRARSFQANGLAVVGFMFRRRKVNSGFVPPWPNVELGVTEDMSYGRRLASLVKALPTLLRHRARLRAGRAIYARNLDMCLLALAARLLAGRRLPIVYEVLDVHRLMTRPGPAGAVLRWCERLLLRRVDLLVVSSPGYMENYFKPVQGYRGEWFLLENKVFLKGGRPPLPAAGTPRPADGRWRIGWFGSLRCEDSLRLLVSIADRLPEQAEIVLYGGYPASLGRKGMEEAIAGRPNIRHGGEYRNPDDLAAIYGEVDLYWGLDFHEKGANSLWLLPNRLYEGGMCGVVAIAAEGTETGRRVAEEGLGFVVEAPYDEAVVRLLSGLTRERYEEMRRNVLAAPRSRFVETDDSQRLCARILDLGHRTAEEGGPSRKGWLARTG